jgi:GTPase-associated protein 1, N-terminal domain type 2/GTPase-associated protein 1, middle domain
VAFQQLYYTSCEHGLGGYGGYQFNAVTPGTSPAIMREVEERTVYEPPRWLQAEPAMEEPEAYPVAFSYGIAQGLAIATHAVFTGVDYSGRPGNYFVHALATGAPAEDFGPVLPAELWGAPLWHREPVGQTELAELPGPPLRGNIDRSGVQAFLDARGAQQVLPELLTAAGHALSGGPPVVLVSDDASENAWWIAAVCYLLGEPTARQLTFTTYSHRPGYGRYHLTGVLPDTLMPDAEASLVVFDFAAGRTPQTAVHPLAGLLASTGVMACAGLWQQAAAFAAGDEASLDDWLGPVAVAAGLLGRALSPAETSAAARWLPGAAGRMSPELADVALGIAAAQPGTPDGQVEGGELAGEELAGLLELARRLPAPARAEQLEQRLVRYGRERLELNTGQDDLTRLVGAHPAILQGLLERLAGEPPEVRRDVLGGPVGARLRREDLARHPELTELWLIQAASRRAIKPLRAFDEIVDIRTEARRSPVIDAALLRLLWPKGCPPGQLTELLGALTDSPGPDVITWLAAEIAGTAGHGTAAPGWHRLAMALAEHPVLPLLPEAEIRAVRTAARILPLLDQAALDGPGGEVTAFAALYQAWADADADAGTRRLLERELPTRLARASPLAAALRGCPPAVAAAFGHELGGWLADTPADADLARRVFTAMLDPGVAAEPALGGPLSAAFEQVRSWRRRDVSTLAQAWPEESTTAQAFRAWREVRRGPLARRLLGGAGS